MIAGVAVAGASLFAVNAPTPAGPLVQHRDVKLAAGEVDWTTFLANVNDNLATLQSERPTSSNVPAAAFGHRPAPFTPQVRPPHARFYPGVNNAMFRRQYWGGNGYV